MLRRTLVAPAGPGATRPGDRELDQGLRKTYDPERIAALFSADITHMTSPALTTPHPERSPSTVTRPPPTGLER
jgi:hypothetical protein